MLAVIDLALLILFVLCSTQLLHPARSRPGLGGESKSSQGHPDLC
jgi:hypothetical protein